MIFKRLLKIFGLFLLFQVNVGYAYEESNALWSDTDSGEIIYLWFFPVTGGCPDLLDKAAPVVVAIKPETIKVNVSEMKYCLQMEDGHRPTPCHSGTLNLDLDKSLQIYKGHYSFQISEEKKQEGDFTAQYCSTDMRLTYQIQLDDF